MTRRLTVAAIPLLVIALAACAPSAAAPDMREAVRQDIAQVMVDIEDAEANDPSLAVSSNPYDYAEVSPAFERLVGRGSRALDSIAEEIESSPDDGLREYLLAIAGERIQGESAPKDWATGKQWAEEYRAAE